MLLLVDKETCIPQIRGYKGPFIRENCFDLDEFIAPAVFNLIFKGYTTDFCCSGHMYDTRIPGSTHHLINNRAYIIFKRGIDIPSLPKGFYKVVDDYATENNVEPRVIIELTYKHLQGSMERMSEIFDAMRELYTWSSELPGV